MNYVRGFVGLRQHQRLFLEFWGLLSERTGCCFFCQDLCAVAFIVQRSKTQPTRVGKGGMEEEDDEEEGSDRQKFTHRRQTGHKQLNLPPEQIAPSVREASGVLILGDVVQVSQVPLFLFCQSLAMFSLSFFPVQTSLDVLMLQSCRFCTFHHPIPLKALGNALQRKHGSLMFSQLHSNPKSFIRPSTGKFTLLQ